MGGLTAFGADAGPLYFGVDGWAFVKMDGLWAGGLLQS